MSDPEHIGAENLLSSAVNDFATNYRNWLEELYKSRNISDENPQDFPNPSTVASLVSLSQIDTSESTDTRYLNISELLLTAEMFSLPFSVIVQDNHFHLCLTSPISKSLPDGTNVIEIKTFEPIKGELKTFRISYETYDNAVNVQPTSSGRIRMNKDTAESRSKIIALSDTNGNPFIYAYNQAAAKIITGSGFDLSRVINDAFNPIFSVQKDDYNCGPIAIFYAMLLNSAVPESSSFFSIDFVTKGLPQIRETFGLSFIDMTTHTPQDDSGITTRVRNVGPVRKVVNRPNPNVSEPKRVKVTSGPRVVIPNPRNPKNVIIGYTRTPVTAVEA